jgi:hypothetical protein
MGVRGTSLWKTNCTSKGRFAVHGGNVVMNSDARLLAMFGGWIMAFWGVRQRSWAGTIIAMLGLGLAQGAMTIGEGEQA